MCGFGGIISRDAHITASHVTRAAAKVSFRGPDSTRVLVYDNQFGAQDQEGVIGVFFNRLAIIDLDKRSDQPFENERYMLVFNGEVYNYKEIRTELEAQAIEFNTTSDTEVLFHLLIRHGTKAIERLNGMFAFVFFDKAERRIILARDRSGIKPLVYLCDNTCFAFASEADTVIRLSGKTPAVCTQAVNAYLALQYVPAPLTIWEGINKLPPGSFLEISMDDLQEGKKPEPVSYFNAYKRSVISNDQENQLEELLAESLRIQLQADVPLGLFLSSGIDSSLLAAMVNKHFSNGQQFNFFTVSFSDSSYQSIDESANAREFLEGFKNEHFSHHILPVSPILIQQELESMYTWLDEPFGDYAVMLNSVISKKAREFVTVALSGDGSDELFWGYNRYNEWKTDRKYTSALAARVVHTFEKLFGDKKKAIHFAGNPAADPVERYLQLISSGYFSQTYSMHDSYWWTQGISAIRDRNDLPSLIDFKTYLPDCMFYKVDRSSMGASLEVRVPFVDNKVIDYALRMPVQKKSTVSFGTKSPLKELLVKLAPHYNIGLPKRGFSLPLNDWITHSWKELAFSDVIRHQLQSAGLLKEYDVLLKMQYHKRRNYAVEVWRLLNLGLWMHTKKNSL